MLMYYLSLCFLNILQEILDQLAEIDLVVNFKCEDDVLAIRQGGSVCPLLCSVSLLMLLMHTQ